MPVFFRLWVFVKTFVILCPANLSAHDLAAVPQIYGSTCGNGLDEHKSAGGPAPPLTKQKNTTGQIHWLTPSLRRASQSFTSLYIHMYDTSHFFFNFIFYMFIRNTSGLLSLKFSFSKKKNCKQFG